MEFRSLDNLSNNELLATTKIIHGKNCESMAELILHLSQVEKRKAHIEAGYSSLHAYCRDELKCSEGGANRRVRAAWCLLKDPGIYDLLKRGETTLCALSGISSAMTVENAKEILTQISGRSKREVELVAAQYGAPVKAKPGTVRAKRVLKSERSGPDLFQAPTPPVECHHFSFWGSTRARELYEEAKGLSGNLPMEEIFERALALYVEETRPKVIKPKKVSKPSEAMKRSRVISRPVRRAVLERDGGQCAYVSPDGRRCSARVKLEPHHIVAYAKGGSNEIDNLMTCCRAHNQYFADKEFGRDFMDRFRKKHHTPTAE